MLAARMRRLAVALAAVAVLPLAPALPSGAAESSGSAGDARPAGPADDLRRLRAQAGPSLLVGRDTDGEARLLGSRGRRPLATPRTRPDAPSAVVARDYLRRFGNVMGLDSGDGLGRPEATASQRPGETVRFQQTVDGVPVLGGEVVVSLDEVDRLRSLGGETTETETAGRAPAVSAGTASRNALAATRTAHGVEAGTLQASEPEQWIYDPALLGASDPFGVRRVWRVEVGDGVAVRDLVLVDAATGRVAARIDRVNRLNRVVCDLQGVPISATSAEPDCRGAYARTETGAASGNTEVDAAFDHAGATADLFRDVAGVDLTVLVGHDAGDGTKLRSTVRVCVQGQQCPWSNAFWNGRGMYYGEGYAAADDVVGHELTHGVIERTANLFYWYQSGAINESFADVFGEIADLRYGDDTGDRAWSVGEDTPGGAIRNMAHPGEWGQPDRMTSADYTEDTRLRDNGGVHANSGVGNKAAYLIAEGGTFNGHTVSGLDASEPSKPKTAAVYWEALGMLTSGSDYQDLALVLPQACRNLAAAGTAGLLADDCVQVQNAVAATEMHLQPVSADAAAPEAETCPEPSDVATVFADDFELSTGAWTQTGVWQRSPYGDMPYPYATSGTRSYFGWDPDPRYGDELDSFLTLKPLTVPADAQAFVSFDHAFLFEWYDESGGRRFVDGGRVEYSIDGGGTWKSAARLPWANGPDAALTLGSGSTTSTGFGGDSHGYVSSRLDLSSLAGHSVRLRWRITGDTAVASGYGWWLDDVRVYSCRTHAPGMPQNVYVQAGPGAIDVTWEPPAWSGTGVAGYLVTATPTGRRVELSADQRSVRLSGLDTGVDHAVAVRAVNGRGQAGTAATGHIKGTRLSASASRPVTFGPTAIRGRLTRADGTGMVGSPVRLYRRPAAGGAWRLIDEDAAWTRGFYDFHVRATQHTRYQVRFPGFASTMPSRSPQVLVRVRPQLTTNVTATSARVGSRPALHGQVFPKLRGEPVRLQRQVGRRWRTVQTRSVTGTGTYRFVLPTSRRGVFRYRAYVPGTATHLAGVGPVRQITVR